MKKESGHQTMARGLGTEVSDFSSIRGPPCLMERRAADWGLGHL